jgi:hypothetical protein
MEFLFLRPQFTEASQSSVQIQRYSVDQKQNHSGNQKFLAFALGRLPTSRQPKSAPFSLRSPEPNPSTAANQNEISLQETANEKLKFGLQISLFCPAHP